LYCSIDGKEFEGKCLLEPDEDFWCSRSRSIWYVSSYRTNYKYGQQADMQVSWFYHEVLFPTTAKKRKWQKGPKSTSVFFPPDRRLADHDIITTQKHAYTCRPLSIYHGIYHLENSESRYNHSSEGVHLLIYRKDNTTAQLLISSHIFLNDRSGSDIQSTDLALGLYPSRI
jgi:hypothetical protein